MRDNVLELGSSESQRVPVPSGVGRRLRELIADERAAVEFELPDHGERLKIRWKSKDRLAWNNAILPLVPWLGATANGRFTFEFVLPGARQVMARSLLVRSHPLGAPTRGVLLAARFTDPAEARDVFAASSQDVRPDPWSEAWRYAPRGDEIVGVAVIDRLLHGDPLGRDRLAETMRKRLPDRGTTITTDAGRRERAETRLRLALRAWADGTGEKFDALATRVGLDLESEQEAVRKRSDVVDALGVMWLSRIAVDAPYRGQQVGGVGGALVAEAKSAVRRLPWDAHSIEVIRTLSYGTDQERARADELIQSAEDGDDYAQDFLTSAGYSLVPNPLRSLPVRLLDDAGNYTPARSSTKKLYYYTLTEEPR